MRGKWEGCRDCRLEMVMHLLSTWRAFSQPWDKCIDLPSCSAQCVYVQIHICLHQKYIHLHTPKAHSETSCCSVSKTFVKRNYFLFQFQRTIKRMHFHSQVSTTLRGQMQVGPNHLTLHRLINGHRENDVCLSVKTWHPVCNCVVLECKCFNCHKCSFVFQEEIGQNFSWPELV